MFGNMVCTDGFSVSFICCRPKRPPPHLNSRVSLEYFSWLHAKKNHKPYYIDPGRARIFITVSGF
ncbi:hypothetical protein K501DRAFT_200654 [Backusella circina FSU 941]|nr:hypothetical protein K501DRAFT_200654 [Backusella circina FSU 941]